MFSCEIRLLKVSTLVLSCWVVMLTARADASLVAAAYQQQRFIWRRLLDLTSFSLYIICFFTSLCISISSGFVQSSVSTVWADKSLQSLLIWQVIFVISLFIVDICWNRWIDVVYSNGFWNIFMRGYTISLDDLSHHSFFFT